MSLTERASALNRTEAVSKESSYRGTALNDRLTRRTNRGSFFLANSCSQIRRTRQPLAFKVLETSRSRARFAASFFSQNGALFFGFVLWRGQPCQKHPSTNNARRSFGKTKSGLPKTACLRRHPVMCCERKTRIKASSVSLFPRPRMRDITALRLAGVKTSVICWFNQNHGSHFSESQGSLAVFLVRNHFCSGVVPT